MADAATVAESILGISTEGVDRYRILYLNKLRIPFTIFHIVTTIIIALILTNVIPPIYSIVTVPSMIAHLPHMFFMNTGLVRKLLTCFEIWFLIIQLVTMNICIGFIFEWNIRAIMIVPCMSSMLVVIFLDAAELPSLRKALVSISGVLAFIFYTAVFFSGVPSYGKSHNINIFGMIYSAEDQCMSRLVTVTALLLRHVCKSIYHPVAQLYCHRISKSIYFLNIKMLTMRL